MHSKAFFMKYLNKQVISKIIEKISLEIEKIILYLNKEQKEIIFIY